jgi:hypothetical protein
VLYDVAKIITTELEARGCPLPIVYGPESADDAALVRSRIVIERSRPSTDTVGPPRTHKLNPPRRAERGIAGRVRIYAHSTVVGARVQDHEEVAEQAADLVIVALQIAVARLETTAKITASGYVPASALAIGPDASVWPGVVYDLSVVVQRGVFDRTWALEAKDTQSDFSITTSGVCTTTAAPDP